MKRLPLLFLAGLWAMPAYSQTPSPASPTSWNNKDHADHIHDNDHHEHDITWRPINPPVVYYVPVPVAPGPCGYISCGQAKLNSDTAELNASQAHMQSLQGEVAKLNDDIDLLDESSGHDDEIAADNAKIDQDQKDMQVTQDHINAVQSAIQADQAALPSQ